ncbi:hypothetical protein B7W85_01935 [Allorhizobium ampelinum]|nr:hypothetical protein B7W85_01935 [Allorhizobium ampelinum]
MGRADRLDQAAVNIRIIRSSKNNYVFAHFYLAYVYPFAHNIHHPRHAMHIDADTGSAMCSAVP